MKKTGVYAIRCTVNGKAYVGSAAMGFTARWKGHRGDLNRGVHYNGHLQAAWNKRGEAAFEFVILEECEAALCLVREQYWIDELKSYDHTRGYNIRIRAESNSGLRHSEESKAKNRKAHLGMGHTPEVRARLAAHFRGKPLTENHRRAISEGSKGKPKSPEHNKKVSEVKLGKKRGPLPEAWRKAMSEAGKGKTQNPEHVRKRIESGLRTRALRRSAQPSIVAPMFSFMKDSE